METHQANLRLSPILNNADYIQNALSSAFECDDLQLESFQMESVNEPGENFCSEIYRLHISYRKCKLAPLEHNRFILKVLLSSEDSNEMPMYQEVLPALQQILNVAQPCMDNPKLSPKCLYIDKNAEREIYLLEDLTALGYRLGNRFVGLSHDEALACLDKIAQFHAASMVLLMQPPPITEKLEVTGYVNGVTDAIGQTIIFGGTSYVADLINDWPDMSHIADKMRAQLPTIYNQRLSDVVQPAKAAFKVIIHGDLWLNNMMIIPNSKQAVLMDFQCCYIGSPAIDLQYFFHTSLQLEDLIQNRDRLLQYYYERFVKVLRACRFTGPLPSYDMLLSEMHRCLFFGYYAVVCDLPIECASKSVSEGLSNDVFQDSAKMLIKWKQIYANDRVQKTLRATLPNFENNGILNTT